MKYILLGTLAVLATTTAASASEAARRDHIDAREAVQKYRIQHARDIGQLTWMEKAKLNYGQYRIRWKAYAKPGTGMFHPSSPPALPTYSGMKR